MSNLKVSKETLKEQIEKSNKQLEFFELQLRFWQNKYAIEKGSENLQSLVNLSSNLKIESQWNDFLKSQVEE